METKCCGTCKWHIRETTYGEFVCDNSESDVYSDWTYYDHCCEKWEERTRNQSTNRRARRRKDGNKTVIYIEYRRENRV